jgi:hypothetical protein
VLGSGVRGTTNPQPRAHSRQGRNVYSVTLQSITRG